LSGIEGTSGSLTGTTHRAEVTADNKLAVYDSVISGVSVLEEGLVVMTHRHWRTTKCLNYSAGSTFYEIPQNGSASILFDVGSVNGHFSISTEADGDTKTVFIQK